MQTHIDAIDHDLRKFESGAGANGAAYGGSRAAHASGGRIGGSSRIGTRRGEMKAKIVAALKAAGKQGLHVKELVKKLGAKENNVRVWFYATGKKIKNIKQTKPATYAWAD